MNWAKNSLGSRFDVITVAPRRCRSTVPFDGQLVEQIRSGDAAWVKCEIIDHEMRTAGSRSANPEVIVSFDTGVGRSQ